MQKQSESGAIRLTNKTALALRRCAKQERTMAFCAATILTMAMAALAVLLGLRWLPAVPLMTAAAVLMDAAIFVRARSRYLSLTAQAICAEAAARQIRTQKKEQDRREQALRDLAGVKEDALRAAKEASRPDQTQAANEDTPASEKETQTRSEDAQENEEKAEEEPQPQARRRRRQATLTVLRKEDAK